jgi:hypothetical protein
MHCCQQPRWAPLHMSCSCRQHGCCGHPHILQSQLLKNVIVCSHRALQVCTAQYFVWWFSLLPLVLQHIRWPPPVSLVVAFALWGVAQLHWLAWGYALEFKVRCMIG